VNLARAGAADVQAGLPDAWAERSCSACWRIAMGSATPAAGYGRPAPLCHADGAARQCVAVRRTEPDQNVGALDKCFGHRRARVNYGMFRTLLSAAVRPARPAV